MIKREEKIERTAEKYAEGCPNAILVYRAFKDGVRFADKHPVKKQPATIKAWVARDKDNRLSLYKEKPYRAEYFFVGELLADFDEDAFGKIPSSVTWENSPKKVKVTIEIEK